MFIATSFITMLQRSLEFAQYAATVYQQQMRAAGMIGSLSRRGNCLDNACVESFFETLKRELIHHRQCRTREEAKEIFEYLEVFYNRQRRHSTFGYQSPTEFEARGAIAQPGVHEIIGRISLPAVPDNCRDDQERITPS
jgi:putative transposase